MPLPDTNKWKNLANEFYDKWQMPNCCGSIDGKHIVHQVRNTMFIKGPIFILYINGLLNLDINAKIVHIRILIKLIA